MAFVNKLLLDDIWDHLQDIQILFYWKKKTKPTQLYFMKLHAREKKNNFKLFEKDYEGTKLRRQIHENKRGWKLKQ